MHSGKGSMVIGTLGTLGCSGLLTLLTLEDPSLFSELHCDASAHQAGESRSQETLQAAPREASQHRTMEDLCASAEMARILPLPSVGVCKILLVRDN